jgi:hypothetical protein
VADRSTPRREDRGPPVLRLPWWVWLAYLVVKFWFLAIPAAIVLVLAGRYGADWLGGLRWAVYGAAALLAAPFAATAVIFIVTNIDAAAYWRTLEHEETVAGLALPAGSKIRFSDKAQSSVHSIDLPRAADIRGMRLVGRLTRYNKWRHGGPVWGGALAEDQYLGGLPCRAGHIAFDKFGTIFDDDGIIHRCTLAAAYELLGLKLPRGTTVWRGNDNKPWSLLLPADAGVDVPALTTTAPPGITLSVANDGQLEGISSGHGQTIVVHGVPLNSKNFHVRRGQVLSELAERFLVAGEMQPAGTGVRIDLPTGRVSISGPGES